MLSEPLGVLLAGLFLGRGRGFNITWSQGGAFAGNALPDASIDGHHRVSWQVQWRSGGAWVARDITAAVAAWHLVAYRELVWELQCCRQACRTPQPSKDSARGPACTAGLHNRSCKAVTSHSRRMRAFPRKDAALMHTPLRLRLACQVRTRGS